MDYWSGLREICAHAALGGMRSLQRISSHGAINVGTPLHLGKHWIFSFFQNTTHQLRKFWKWREGQIAYYSKYDHSSLLFLENRICFLMYFFFSFMQGIWAWIWTFSHYHSALECCFPQVSHDKKTQIQSWAAGSWISLRLWWET